MNKLLIVIILLIAGVIVNNDLGNPLGNPLSYLPLPSLESPADRASVTCNKDGGQIYLDDIGKCSRDGVPKRCFVMTCEFATEASTTP